MSHFSNYTDSTGPGMPSFRPITPCSMDLSCAHFFNYAASNSRPAMLNFPFFLFISMPPKKRKRTVTPNRPKGIGGLYFEDVYVFDAEQLTSDFVLTHGHIWYYLVMHQFDIHETTTLLKPLQ